MFHLLTALPTHRHRSLPPGQARSRFCPLPPRWGRRYASSLLLLLLLSGCWPLASRPTDPDTPPATETATPTPDSSPIVDAQVLQESWDAYRRRFIQEDGRVIDWEGRGRSTSESQAYAMLRAVMINDRQTFDLTLAWGENNLKRQKDGQQLDSLWAWKWGEQGQFQTPTPTPQATHSPTASQTRPNQTWTIIDGNFASDADIDVVTALILGARRWGNNDYLTLARRKLKDLWDFSTVQIGDRRYLLPGPKTSFQKPDRLELNPSYLAPYAFRLFAQIDPERDWQSLVTSSYEILEQSSRISSKGLPSDWVAFNLKTRKFEPLSPPSTLITQYGFDAYRVWWRVALDLAWFNAPEARPFLQTSMQHLQDLWQTQRQIPAQLNLQGEGIVNYEATSQYGMIYSAWQLTNPALAREIYEEKILPRYRDGLWDDDSAYYSQNMAWLGLFPPGAIPQSLLEGS